MLENCFTNETAFIEFEQHDNSKDYLSLLAKKIAEETTIPIKGINNNRLKNWHIINGEYYYFKSFNSYFLFFNELLGEVISKYFNLDTIHYEIAKQFDDNETQFGIISKNFCNKEFIYKTLSEYIFENAKLNYFEPDLSIIDKIKIICKTEEEFLLLQKDLKKMIIRHLYNALRDAYGHNIMLKTTPHGIRLAPLYDYEEAYISFDRLHKYTWDIGELDITNKKTKALFRSDQMFQELLYKLMTADMSNFITEIEDMHKIIVPTEQKEHYIKYEAQIKKLVLKNRLVK